MSRAVATAIWYPQEKLMLCCVCAVSEQLNLRGLESPKSWHCLVICAIKSQVKAEVTGFVHLSYVVQLVIKWLINTKFQLMFLFNQIIAKLNKPLGSSSSVTTCGQLRAASRAVWPAPAAFVAVNQVASFAERPPSCCDARASRWKDLQRLNLGLSLPPRLRSTHSLQSPLWFPAFRCHLPLITVVLGPPFIVPSSICLVLSPPILFPPLTISRFPSLYLNPSISSSAPFSWGAHREWCTNTIPHISNEYLVIILSPQRLSVWLRLSLDSLTNGTASFSTAAIPQRWQTDVVQFCEHSSEGLSTNASVWFTHSQRPF